MNKIKIYLAGKMSGLSFEEMNSWRNEAIKLLSKTEYPIHTENPCDFYNFEMPTGSYTESEVKKFDLWLVENCDVVLVNLDYPDSIGTAIELHMAHDVWNKPVIAFGTAKNHPWIELSITKRCNTLEEAVEHITYFYLSNI